MGLRTMPGLARVVVCLALGAWANSALAQSPAQASSPAPKAGQSSPAAQDPSSRPDAPPTAPGSSPTEPGSAPITPSEGNPLAKPVPPTPIAVKKAELDEPAWDPVWSTFVEKTVPAELLSRKREREVRSLCPRFKDLSYGDRRIFWAYFFQALAAAEAGLKPTADVRHDDPEVAVEDTVTHRIVRQEGLLQLAYMDSQRYGCAFDWEKDKDLPEHDPAKTILQPETNLLCGIKILTNQIVTQKKPLLTSTSYWVTLQPDRSSFRMFMKQMANEPAFCGRPLVHVPEPDETSPAAPSQASR